MLGRLLAQFRSLSSALFELKGGGHPVDNSTRNLKVVIGCKIEQPKKRWRRMLSLVCQSLVSVEVVIGRFEGYAYVGLQQSLPHLVFLLDKAIVHGPNAGLRCCEGISIVRA